MVAGLIGLYASAAQAQSTAGGTVKLNVVGGLAGLTQYTKLEQPFWQSEIAEMSNGRISATIRPLDGGGLRGQEMLQLLRLGVVSFGTALLSVVAGDEPELNAIDLPVLNPDIATLRRTVAAFRQHLADVLRTRYDIELLGVYTYPAQVLFCKSAFKGLDDLVGRKVRTSSVGQSELMAALGAIPVLVPFAEIVPALREGVTDCAITGTLSGYEIGLPDVTTHVHDMAISWGLSVFGANRTTWNSLPADVRSTIRSGVAELERRIWLQAGADTERGLSCNAGAASCGTPPSEPMTIVPLSKADASRRRHLLEDVVLPRWIARCGLACVQAWNTYLAPTHSITVSAE
ncbi:TRAP transporter substrate-binding protein [Ancylobacter sp. MQZ15Z-1]|uniref:TRAP transporter substrate-binding protein n=1 Tax=Ancylobacter mangrovi TaxID=2972472 RepID=A0A9X2PF96_9HYPH|nr:TRAP transporter substrate-binding protein [Ancylobacter mangrovi]MCS0494417.1 TRAP transporter substrate-binding protein [Ancylobacter mangrovi]